MVTIGAYDGVHLGHRAVIGEVRARAAAEGRRSAVVTFDRHPAQVIRPDSAPLLLTDLDQKLELLADTGVDYTLVVHFDEERAAETAEHFVESVLVDCLARGVGRRRGGLPLRAQPAWQRRAARPRWAHGSASTCSVTSWSAPTGSAARDDAQVSSTAIRRALHEGRLIDANLMLGRPHEMRGSGRAGRPAGPHARLPDGQRRDPRRDADAGRRHLRRLVRAGVPAARRPRSCCPRRSTSASGRRSTTTGP